MTGIRSMFALALLVSMLLVLGAQSVGAQSPTPISVPSPTAEECDQVPTYLEARQKIFDETINGMTALFPEVATPITEHGDELFVALLFMSPAEYEALAKIYDDAADKTEKLRVPVVANFYNGLQVQLYRLSADVFQEAAKSGLSNAGELFNDQLVAIGDAVMTSGDSATSVCPAFADVVKLDQTQAGI